MKKLSRLLFILEFPSAIFDGTTYYMWYSGGGYFTWEIGYARSLDGSNWTEDPSNPVLSRGKTGSWDSRSVAPISVINNSGKYKMWYFGSHAEGYASI